MHLFNLKIGQFGLQEKGRKCKELYFEASGLANLEGHLSLQQGKWNFTKTRDSQLVETVQDHLVFYINFLVLS